MSAWRLIQIFAEQPAAVGKVVGLPIVRIEGFTIPSMRKGKRRIAKISR